jgi:DNA invertase Pin-like site-specific DNA recombinase
MCGVFAEFERSMIREQLTAGLARAKKHGTCSGKPIGRPRNGSERLASRMLKLRHQGWGLLRIGRELRIGTRTVQRILSERA